MNDTDILANEFAAAGDRIAALERAGKCAHDRTQGFGPVVCRDCGRVFATRDEADAAYLEATA